MFLTEIAVILLLVLLNGVFAAAEIAVVAVRKTRIEILAEEGRSGARAVLTLLEQPERFLATVQVGITVVGAAAAAFGGASIAARLAPLLAQVAWIGNHAEGVALAVVIVGVSYLSVVVGELVPKALALRGAERCALVVGRPLLGLSWLANPLVWLLSASANLLLKPFGGHTSLTETQHSAEEIQDLVVEATKAGTIHPEAGEIASRALEFADLTAADVMVVRQNVVMIPRRASLEELQRILLEHTHNRIPVYEDRIDNVVGYINVKDLLAVAWEQRLIVLEDVMRAPYFAPESTSAVELLRNMRERRTPLALVVDEHGGTSGIVTMEDLLEELVGEILSEHTQKSAELFRREEDESVILEGAAPLREVNRALRVDLPTDGDWTTVAGLCLALFGRMPSEGEGLSLPSGLRLEIVEASARHIRLVRIRLPPPASEASRPSA